MARRKKRYYKSLASYSVTYLYCDASYSNTSACPKCGTKRGELTPLSRQFTNPKSPPDYSQININDLTFYYSKQIGKTYSSPYKHKPHLIRDTKHDQSHTHATASSPLSRAITDSKKTTYANALMQSTSTHGHTRNRSYLPTNPTRPLYISPIP